MNTDVIDRQPAVVTDSLRAGTGALPSVLLQLAELCRNNRAGDGELDRAHEQLLRVVPARADASRLLQEHGLLSWPASMGQSPYADFTYVLRCAVDGHGLMPGATRNQRHLHARLIVAYGSPSAVARMALDMNGLEQRYPRLLRAMRDAAILSFGEAQSALYLLLQTHPGARRHCSASCEAVAHFGGNLAVVRAAIRRRRLFPSTRLSRRDA